MSNRNLKNLLSQLGRNGNKYIHPNSIPKSMHIATPEASPSPIPFDYNQESRRHTYSNDEEYNYKYSISNTYTHPSYVHSKPDPKHPLYEPEVKGYLAPHKIKYPLEIILIKGGTEQARTRHSFIECTTEPTSIEKTLMWVLHKEQIKIPLSHFNLGYREKYIANKHKKQKQKDVEKIQSIYDYNIGEILLKDIKTFTLRQALSYEDPATKLQSLSSFTKSGNKARMENQYQSIKRAELILKNNLGAAGFEKLQKNKALLLEAKYDLVCLYLYLCACVNLLYITTVNREYVMWIGI